MKKFAAETLKLMFCDICVTSRKVRQARVNPFSLLSLCSMSLSVACELFPFIINFHVFFIFMQIHVFFA